MVKQQITFKVKHDAEDPNEIRINGEGSVANVHLRRLEGWYIPDVDYTVTWKLNTKGEWMVSGSGVWGGLVVCLDGKMPYQVCKFPTDWQGKKLTRIVKIIQ